MERLSGMDAVFLYLETPTQHMHVTLTAVLDPAGMPGGFSFTAIREHVASRIHLVPPFTRRLVPVPLRLHHPLWVDDPDFDLDRHVRRAALPSPGTDAQLAELTAQISSIGLDRARPLWEIWVVEGLEGGRFALVAKLHHSTLDGIAGVEQMVNFFDFDRAGREIEAPPPREPEAIPTDAELLTHAAVSKVRSALDVMPLVRRTAEGVLAVRRRRAERDDDRTGALLTAPRVHLNGTIGAQRRVAFARVPLDGIKTVKGAVDGATVNDVLLTLCGGALRRYLAARGELPDLPLVAACPVSTRTDDQRGVADNRVSAIFTRLHTDLDDPIERLAAAHEEATAAKEEHALYDPDTWRNWAEILDPNVFSFLADLYATSGLARRHRPAINLMISNVPGPPFPLYLAGAELVRAFPMGQVVEGVGLNITVMSYRDSVDFGFMAAADIVPDVWDLAHQVTPAFDELVTAAASI